MTIVSLDDEIERVYEYTSKEELKPLAAFPLRIGIRRLSIPLNSIHAYKSVDFQVVRDPLSGDVYKLKAWRMLKVRNSDGRGAILQSKIYRISKQGNSRLIGSFICRSPFDLAVIAGKPAILDPFTYQSIWTTVSGSTYPLPPEKLKEIFLTDAEKTTVRKLIGKVDNVMESTPPHSPSYNVWIPSWFPRNEAAINRKYKAVCVFGNDKISVDWNGKTYRQNNYLVDLQIGPEPFVVGRLGAERIMKFHKMNLFPADPYLTSHIYKLNMATGEMSPIANGIVAIPH